MCESHNPAHRDRHRAEPTQAVRDGYAGARGTLRLSTHGAADLAAGGGGCVAVTRAALVITPTPYAVVEVKVVADAMRELVEHVSSSASTRRQDLDRSTSMAYSLRKRVKVVVPPHG